MPKPTRTARGIRLRDDALDLMAAALGEEAWRGGKNGRPNYAILTGENRTGIATRLMRGESAAPETIAIVSQRYADAAGIEDFWEAAAVMFGPIDAEGRPLPRRRGKRATRAESALEGVAA